jgi:outer membrane protein OmpA-like peptidoglycan-associated protein
MKARFALAILSLLATAAPYGFSQAPETAPVLNVALTAREKLDVDPKSEHNRQAKAALLDRREIMYGIDAPKDDKIFRRVAKAYNLVQVLRIPFAPGSRALTKEEADSVKAALDDRQMQNWREDPTAQFIIMGFADTPEDSVDNIYLSKDRADSIFRLLRSELGIQNVLFPIPMGGSPLLDEQNPKREFAVEIWILRTLER